jgi:threonine dehydratase
VSERRESAATTLEQLLSLDDVLAARQTIGGRLHRTPVFSSATLGSETGGRCFLKAELFQRTGSFKPRGVLNKLASLSSEEKRRGVISISAGNHAQALAYASALEGIDALVVMWHGASEQKIAAARQYGATIDLEAEGSPEAFERLHELLDETGRTLVHPFDDPTVMAGQGTIGLEIVEDVPDVDVVLVPVGGGGLVSGIATAVRALRPDARIVAVEPELSPALHEGLRAGRQVRVEPKSIADGLAGPFAGEKCLAICTALGVETALVSEEALAEAFRFLYARAKLACEVAGAATTAALLAGNVEILPGQSTVAVVSGGNVAPEIASAILASR